VLCSDRILLYIITGSKPYITRRSGGSGEPDHLAAIAGEMNLISLETGLIITSAEKERKEITFKAVEWKSFTFDPRTVFKKGWGTPG
jgi:hypothetical protein